VNTNKVLDKFYKKIFDPHTGRFTNPEVKFLASQLGVKPGELTLKGYEDF
jgi:hypothetical protein